MAKIFGMEEKPRYCFSMSRLPEIILFFFKVLLLYHQVSVISHCKQFQKLRFMTSLVGVSTAMYTG